jgi:hypothetical protein
MKTLKTLTECEIVQSKQQGDLHYVYRVGEKSITSGNWETRVRRGVKELSMKH